MSINQIKPRDCRTGFGPSHPAVTPALLPGLPNGWKSGGPELEELWHDIIKELTEKEYRNRTHGSRRTSEAGCSGPVCSKAVREHGRRRTQAQPSERYKYLDPLIDYFCREATRELEIWDQEVRRALSSLF